MILVTGGSGFVGRHVVRAIRHRPVMDWSLPGFDVFDGDPGEFDAVIHCAANADISSNWATREGREALWRANVDGTMHLLERIKPSTSFVFVSTMAVLSKSASPYEASKSAAERLVAAYTQAGRCLGRVVRLPSCVGTGYRHGHIADFVRMAKEGPIRALDRGDTRKPFVHVEDAAGAIVGALGSVGDPINVSGGALWGWRDTVEIMRMRRSVDVNFVDVGSGWVGDPLDLGSYVTATGRQSVVRGVKEALEDLGWQ